MFQDMSTARWDFDACNATHPHTSRTVLRVEGCGDSQYELAFDSSGLLEALRQCGSRRTQGIKSE